MSVVKGLIADDLNPEIPMSKHNGKTLCKNMAQPFRSLVFDKMKDEVTETSVPIRRIRIHCLMMKNK